MGIVSKGHLVETDRSGLVAGYVGQTAPRTRAVLESALGGTLLTNSTFSQVFPPFVVLNTPRSGFSE